MRLLRFNGKKIDIDEKTAIGITYQSYDITDISKRKTNLSNSFTVPATDNNREITGFADDPQSTDLSIYEKYVCDYWVDNEKLIDSANIQIKEISGGRLKIFVHQKDEFWDELKNYPYQTFLVDYLEWLQDEKGVPASTDAAVTYFTGNFSNFMQPYIDATEGLIFPYYFGNLFRYEPGGEGTGFLETENVLYISAASVKGGHFCSFVKTIFQFIEFKFDVDFLTSSGVIWDDQFISKCYIPIRDLIVINISIPTQWAFLNSPSSATPFAPYEDTVIERLDKSLYDFVLAFIQTFDITMDEEYINEQLTISMRRWDDIKTGAQVIDFSDNIDMTKVKFTPSVKGFNQINKIRYGTVFPGGDKDQGAKTIICNNKNLELNKTLFSIDSYFADVVLNTNLENVVDLSTEDSLETFVFLVSAGTTTNFIGIKIADVHTTAKQLQISAIYGISGEYNFIEDIIAYPRFYTIQKWLTLSDLIGLKSFQQHYIRQLNGSFFINKISGFNPELSNKPTKIELIKVSDRTPIPEYLLEFFVDGTDIPFVDGTGDYFT
jgi:hypothetical protein